MDNKIKSESEDLPNEKTKPPLGKSFSSNPAALDSFAAKFKGGNEDQLLTTVSKASSQLLSKEQNDKWSPAISGTTGDDPSQAQDSNTAWTMRGILRIKIFLN